MITYRDADFGIRIPVLHDVVLRIEPSFSLDRMSQLLEDYTVMHKWCEQNCESNFYFYPSWTGKLGAQFENDEDAVMFALRWS